MSSIYDKKLGSELLSAPLRLAISTDIPRNYPAWNMDFAQEQAAPRTFVGGPAEIRISEDAAQLEDALTVSTRWLGAKSISGFVAAYPWVWPAAECLHFIGLCLVFGLLLAVNLRLLGFMRGLSFASLHRLLPWGILAFAVNLVTGMLFFISAPEQYTANGPFYWKVVFLGLAGVNFLYLTVFDKTWALKEGDEPRPLDKALAGATIALWIGVIYAGRMLPFIGNAF